jgi:hypothetical protein
MAPSCARSFSAARIVAHQAGFGLLVILPRLQAQPGGFFFCFFRRRRMLAYELSIRRSLLRPGLPANRIEQPIAARNVFEREEE